MGGRLGRDHTLEDVPNHFLRDCLMDYINQSVPAELKDDACKAVFSDLSASEIEEYSTVIANKTEKEKNDDEAEAKADNARMDEILKTHKVKSTNEALNILQQEKLLDTILEDVDPTPHPNFGRRDDDKHEPIFKSVTKPGTKITPEEEALPWERYVDRNCDRVRLMIKRFTRGGDWTIDQSPLALGGIARPQLSTFLEKRGPSEGSTSRVFELSWEFFKKRELLGLPVPLVERHSDSAGPQQGGADHGTKRPVDGGEDDPNKRPKVIEID